MIKWWITYSEPTQMFINEITTLNIKLERSSQGYQQRMLCMQNTLTMNFRCITIWYIKAQSSQICTYLLRTTHENNTLIQFPWCKEYSKSFRILKRLKSRIGQNLTDSALIQIAAVMNKERKNYFVNFQQPLALIASMHSILMNDIIYQYIKW